MESRIIVEKLSNLEEERWIWRLSSFVFDWKSGNFGGDSDIDTIGCDIFGWIGMIINWRDSKVNAVFLIFLRNCREEFATRNFELLIIFYYRIISR